MKYKEIAKSYISNYNDEKIILIQAGPTGYSNEILLCDRSNGEDVKSIKIDSDRRIVSFRKSKSGVFFRARNFSKKINFLYHVDYNLKLKQIDLENPYLMQEISDELLLVMDMERNDYVVYDNGKELTRIRFGYRGMTKHFTNGMLMYKNLSRHKHLIVYYVDYRTGKEWQYKGVDLLRNCCQAGDVIIILWISKDTSMARKRRRSYLCGLDVHTGEELWRSYDFVGIRLMKGPGDVFVNFGRTLIRYCNPKTGEVISSFTRQNKIEHYTSITSIEGERIFAIQDERIVCINTSNNLIEWDYSLYGNILEKGRVKNMLSLKNGEMLCLCSHDVDMSFIFNPHDPENIALSNIYEGKIISDKLNNN